MEQFLQGNDPLSRLLNEDTLFMSWRRSAIKQVNDWALSQESIINPPNTKYQYHRTHICKLTSLKCCGSYSNRWKQNMGNKNTYNYFKKCCRPEKKCCRFQTFTLMTATLTENRFTMLPNTNIHITYLFRHFRRRFIAFYHGQNR